MKSKSKKEALSRVTLFLNLRRNIGQARDDIQQAFLHAMHDSVADLSKITPFDELKKMGGSWSLSQIEDWQSLLRPS